MSPVAQAAGIVLLGGAALAAYFVLSSDPAGEESGREGEISRTQASPRGGAHARREGGLGADRSSSRDRSIAAELRAAPATSPSGVGPERARFATPTPSEPGAAPGEVDPRGAGSMGSEEPTAERSNDGGLPLGAPVAGSRPRVVPGGLLPRRIGPTTPELTLHRWEGMERAVEDRITVLNEELARHREAGLEGRAARTERFLRELEAQRPVLARRIEEARREVGEAGPNEAPGD